MKRGIVASKLAVLTLSLGAAAAGAQETSAALRALDYGEGSARGLLQAEAAEESLWLAFLERGDARRAAAERAAAGATGQQAWVKAAARGLTATDPAQTVAGLREATGLAPDNARLWKHFGDVLEAQGDRAGARNAFARAASLAPTYPAANLALGDLERDAADFGAAYNAYNHALDPQNRPISALLGRAASRLYLGDADGALSDLDLALSVAQPGSERSRVLMSYLYLRTFQRALPQGLDRAQEAVEMWTGLGRADMVAATCNAVGRVLLETGRPADAVEWYERGWQAIEGSSLVATERTIWKVRELHGRARAAATRRDLGRARELAAEAERLMATDTANADHYAWIGPYLTGYLKLAERKYGEAVVELRRSDLERAHLRYLLAEAYARNRDRAQAKEWYEKALAVANGLDPESAIVRPLATAWLAKNP